MHDRLIPHHSPPDSENEDIAPSRHLRSLCIVRISVCHREPIDNQHHYISAGHDHTDA